jgi:hypothetical protein
MKKFFVFALLSLVAFASVSSTATAQYSRREVAPPVAETEELDPSTPLGKVQEIARRLEAIESSTDEIGRALEENKLPEYKKSIDAILEASGATRSEVARLGGLADSVRFVVGAVETNAKATTALSANVAALDDRLTATHSTLEKTFLEAIASANAEQMEKITTFIEEALAAERAAFAEYRAVADADAQTLKNKLETASNIIILLGLGVLALFVVNVAKFIFDKAQQAQQAERERRNAEIRELVATANKTEK